MSRLTLLTFVLLSVVFFTIAEENIEAVLSIDDFVKDVPQTKLIRVTRDLASEGTPYSVGRRRDGKTTVILIKNSLI